MSGNTWFLNGPRACVLALAVVCLARADVIPARDNPYRTILDRNPFALQDPPPPPLEIPSNPPPVQVDLKLTGISVQQGVKKAWFAIPPQPGKSANFKYFSLFEDGEEEGVRVVRIDEVAARVTVINAGQTIDLNFQDNGLPAPTALAVPNPIAAPASAPAGRGVAVPGKPAANVPQPLMNSPVAPPANAQPAATMGSGSVPIPARNLRTQPAPTADQPTADPAVQYTIMKAQEQAARRQGIAYPPVPPLPGLIPE